MIEIDLQSKFFPQDTVDYLEIINLLNIMVWSFIIIFGVCEFGEKLSETFGEISYVYDQFTWYLFPYELQQDLATLIMFAQIPVELRVFGHISCGRITFKNVRNFEFCIKFNKNCHKFE